MNELTKFLIKEMLDEPNIVAIYGGGFKPPTKGHFNVVKKTLEDFPEIDELKIFVGGGVRDGITQEESIQVWDIYKNYLSNKVNVEPSVAPVKSVLGYAKENPDTKVYWILGAREDNEDDLKDIENRTKSLVKYPNIEVKVITTSGGVSGTKVRQSIKDNNKEQFFHLIPDIKEKEQVWDIVSPVVKEAEMGMVPTDILGKQTQQDINNFITNIKTKFQKFISSIKQEGKETKEAVSLLVKAAKGNIELSDKQKEQIGNQLKDVLKTIGLVGIATIPGGFIAGALIKLFKAEHLVTPSSFVNEVGEANLKPYKWEEVDAEGYYVYTRFVTDSETQYDVDIKSSIYFPPGQMDSVPALEIEFSAKPKGAEGSSSKIVVNKGEMYRVMSTIVNIIKKYLKKSKAEAIIYSPSKKSSEENFGTQRDNLYRAFISKAFPGTTFKQSGDYITAVLPNNINEATKRIPQTTKSGKKRPASKHSDLYTDEDPKGTITGLGFKDSSTARAGITKINKAKTTHAHKVQATLVMKQRAKAAIERTKDPEKKKKLQAAYKIWSDKLEQLKRKTKSMKKEATDPQAGTALPYGSGFAPVKENDLFGLNELAKTFVKEVFEETWNPEKDFLSLSVFMKDNGMNITPLPKIKVIKDDEENASRLLGKTAYYNPADKSITLYTLGRHPKDVLRSFAHEMVHHMQNLEGRLGNINTTNTNEDGHLDKIEREAIEIGGIMLRKWEDSIKNV